MAFDNLLGNEKNKEILSSTIKNNNVLHSYLFVGAEGIGKTSFAKEFAKMILCEGENRPCNICSSCIEFETDNHPDYMHIKPEDQKSIKIEQIRYLKEKIIEKPITSNKKVYLISQCETMTREAANSLLKILEEPPEYIVIILTTENENKVLTTIKSRCMKLYFEPIPDDKILSYLKHNGIDTDISENMLKMCEGSIGKALNINEMKEKYLQIEKIVDLLKKTDITQIWKNAEVLYQEKDNIIELLSYMEIVLYNLVKNKNKIKYAKGISIIEKTKRKIMSNANFDMSIDYLLLNLWEEVN